MAPWDGSGNVTRTNGTNSGTTVWQDDRDDGVNIRADRHDTHDEDLAGAIENAIALDGQNTTTTDGEVLRYVAGNNRFEGSAPGTGDNDVPTNSDLNDRGFAQQVDSVSALRSGSYPSSLDRIWLSGYYGVGTAGGGPLYRDSADTTTADNGGTVFVDADGVRWKRDYDGEIFVTWFGAKGDGSTDDSSAIQSAVDFVSSLNPNYQTVRIPSADYVIGQSISITDFVEFRGDGFGTRGTRIRAKSSLNAPIFDVSFDSIFRHMTILGTNDIGNTSESCIRVQSANNVALDYVSLRSSYDSLLLDGTNSIFYLTISNCRFQNAKSSWIKIDNTSNGGVDLIISDTRFLGDLNLYGWLFNNGLGSIICDNVQMSVTGTHPSNELCFFGTPANAYGGAQFSDCVFEGGTTRFNGASGSPWKEVHLSNTLFTANGSDMAVKIDWADGIIFESCTFSSSNSTGIVQFGGFVNSERLRMTDCNWEGSGSAPPLYAGSSTTIQLDVTNPSWGGSAAFIDFSAVPSSQLALTVKGGEVGTATTPIILSDYKNTDKDISVFGDNYGPLQRETYVGTLDGSGNASVSHGVTGLNRKIARAEAWYRGGSGQAIPMTVDFVDGSNISISGGGASASYRLSIRYTIEEDSAW